MSLVSERTCFLTNARSFTVEGEPLIIDVLEKIAVAFGAHQDEYVRHKFIFDSKSAKMNEYALRSVEKVWDKLYESNITKIKIYYMNECLNLEGDDERFKALIALLRALGKEIHDNEVTFSKSEQASFYAIYDIAEKLEIIPT